MKGEKMKLEQKFGLSENGVSVMLYPMLKKSYMKAFVVVLAFSVLSHVSAAATSARVDAPLPVSPNGEAHATKAVPAIGRLVRTVKVTLSLDASPVNSAAVTLGKTWQGSLPEPEKAALVLGYDRGEWHIRGDRLRKRFTGTDGNPSTGPRTLVARVRLGPDGAPVSVAFNSGGQPVLFAGLEADALLSWLDPRGWEAVRVTARGGATNVSAEVEYLQDATHIILR